MFKTAAYCIAFCTVFVSQLYGQSQKLTTQNPFVASTNPAIYMMLKFEKVQLSAGGQLWGGNNNFSYKVVDKLLKGEVITYSETEKMAKKSKKHNVIGAGYTLDLIQAAYKKDNNIFTFGVDETDFLSMGYNQNTGKLLWQGNSQFEDKTVTVDKAKFYWHHLRNYKVGFATTLNDKFHVGANLKLIQGMRQIRTKTLTGSVYTAPYGQYIDFTMDYEFNTAGLGKGSSGAFKFNGIGAGVDLGMVYDLSDNQHIYANINNLGMVSWKGNPTTYTESKNKYRFEGQVISNIFEVTSNQGNAFDTLQNVFNSKLTTKKYTDRLPMMVQLGYSQNINEQLTLSATLSQGYHASIPFRPHLEAAVGYKINDYFSAGGCLGVLGFNNVNVGVHGAFQYDNLNIWLSSAQITGMILPKIGTGIDVQAGIGYNF